MEPRLKTQGKYRDRDLRRAAVQLNPQYAHNVYWVGRSEYGVDRVNHSQSTRREKAFGWRSLHHVIESHP
jgi:hypothetical protein